ncbi:hypothetical protein [Nocardioides sp.]|uniref:hypothetical protein n=1 Tax=Nocardioides sp. TaxID=35761 RepID=UPI0039E59005
MQLPPVTSPTADAVRALDHLLDAPRGKGVSLGNWRWAVRQRLTTVRDRLTAESLNGQSSWLASQGGALRQERNDLLTRIGAQLPHVLEAPDPEALRRDLKRLIVDITRHLHRASEQATGGDPGKPE